MYYNNNSVLRIISRWPHKPTNITFGGHHPLWFSCMVFLYGFLWFIQVKPCEMPIFHVISISYGFIIETYGFSYYGFLWISPLKSLPFRPPQHRAPGRPRRNGAAPLPGLDLPAARRQKGPGGATVPGAVAPKKKGWEMTVQWRLPSGKLTYLWRITIYSGFSHEKLWFSIVI